MIAGGSPGKFAFDASIGVPTAFHRRACNGPSVRALPLFSRQAVASPLLTLDGSQYTSKVLNQAASGDYHGFPQSADAFSGEGTVSQIVGGDGVTRWRLTIPGSYNGKTGVFEYIRNPDGTINHRLFVPNR